MPVYLDHIVYVHVPKCGGTSMTNALEEYVVEVLKGQGMPDGYPGEVRRLRKHESIQEIKNYYTELFDEKRWQNAIKFTTIRNPADRIVSWFKYRQRTLRDISKLPGFWDDDGKFLGVHPEHGGKYHWDPLGSMAVTLTKDEAESGENCYHWTVKEEVEKFLELDFHEYVNKATVWKHSGCDHPDCPYHLVSPQVDWLTDEEGHLAVDAIFRLEDIDEVYGFLPDLPKLAKENAGPESMIDYRKQLTEDSLRVILDYYVQDFELYSLLKKEQESGDDVDSDPPQPQGG